MYSAFLPIQIFVFEGAPWDLDKLLSITTVYI